MLDAMSPDDYLEFRTLYQLDPWDGARADLRAAQIAALLYNANRDPKKTRALKVEDFMPDYGGQRRQHRRQQTVAEMVAIGMQWVAAGGGRIVTPGKPAGQLRSG